MIRDTAKRSSRKLRAPAEKPRSALSFRVAPELKGRLEDAAVKRGRSLSQEAEFRLERSFETEGLLIDVLLLAFGGDQVLADEIISYGDMIRSIRSADRLIEQGWVDEKFLRPHIEQNRKALRDFHITKAEELK